MGYFPGMVVAMSEEAYWLEERRSTRSYVIGLERKVRKLQKQLDETLGKIEAMKKRRKKKP